MLFSDPYKNIHGHIVTSQNTAESIDPLGRNKPSNTVVKTTFSRAAVRNSGSNEQLSKGVATFMIILFMGIFAAILFGIIQDIKAEHDELLDSAFDSASKIRHHSSISLEIDGSRIDQASYTIEEMGKRFTIEHGQVSFKETANIYAISLAKTHQVNTEPTYELTVGNRNNNKDRFVIGIADKEVWDTSAVRTNCNRLSFDMCVEYELYGENDYDLFIRQKINGEWVYKLYYRLKDATILIEYHNSILEEKDAVALVKEVQTAVTSDSGAPYAFDMATHHKIPFDHYIGTYKDIEEINFAEKRITIKPNSVANSKGNYIEIYEDEKAFASCTMMGGGNIPYTYSRFECPSGEIVYRITDQTKRQYKIVAYYEYNNKAIYVDDASELKKLFDDIYSY